MVLIPHKRNPASLRSDVSLSGEIEFGLRIELIIAISGPRATMFDKILVYQAIFGPEMGNGCPEKYKTGEKCIWTSPKVSRPHSKLINFTLTALYGP